MEYEAEITERMQTTIVEALRNEMMRGWSLDQLIPILNNAIQDAINEIQEDE